MLCLLGDLLLKEDINFDYNIHDIGEDMMRLMHELFPICRSITGNGVRETLSIMKKYISLEKFEIPTGKKVFDWTIPNEWNILDGYIIDPNGKKIVDFKKSNLHILNYSVPIDKTIEFSELKKHIFTDSNMPDAIPYVTSYYKKNWGFCMTHNQLLKLRDGKYKVKIDSTLKPGHLTYGEFFKKGKIEDEILISTYVCHPSLCNDNLSGIVFCTLLGKILEKFSLNHSIRFLFIPETIGAITWLSLNEKNIHKIKHGLNISDIGNKGKLVYKKSRIGNTKIDEIAINVLNKVKDHSKTTEFYPYGSDERQYCSPGLNLPVGHLMREFYDITVNGKQNSGYHTSADNFSVISQDSLEEAFKICVKIILEVDGLEMEDKEESTNKIFKKKIDLQNQQYYYNLKPKCEPQLGKYNIYEEIGGMYDLEKKEMKFAFLWVLNFSDGEHSLQDISKKSGINIEIIRNASNILEEKQLISKFDTNSKN